MEYTLFKPSYKSGPASVYHIRFRDHLRNRQTLAAFAREADSHRFAQRLAQLVESRMQGTPVDASAKRWLEQLDERTAHRLRVMEIIDPRTTFSDKPLIDHLIGSRDKAGAIAEPGYQQHLQAKGDTDGHVAKTVKRVRTIIEAVGLDHFKDMLAPGAVDRVQNYLGEQRRKQAIGGVTLNYYVTALRGFCKWLESSGRAPMVALGNLAKIENAAVDRQERRALLPAEMQALMAWLDGEACCDRFGLLAAERSALYRFAFETGIRPSQIRALTVGNFNLESEFPCVTSQARHVKRRKTHTQALRPALAATLRHAFENRLPAAPAFRMPDATNLVKMFVADLADVRAAWIAAGGSPRVKADRGKSDFMARMNHQGEKAVFYSLRHGHGTALALAGIPEATIAASMHHTNRQTTQRYIHASIRNIAAAHQSALPDFALKIAGTS